MWVQQSGRNFKFSSAGTGPSVGPASYSIIAGQIEPKKPSPVKPRIEPRGNYPVTDLVTPGPGAYGADATKYDSMSRPGSPCFKSKAARVPSAIDFHTPSGADHGVVKDWLGKYERKGPMHHPPKYKRAPSTVETYNHVDEKGRFVNIYTNKRTPEDIGPGTYTDISVPPSRRTHINVTERSFDLARRTPAPSPDLYTLDGHNSRLLVSIKGQYDSKRARAISDLLIDAPQPKSTRRPNSVFRSRSRRGGDEPELTPGPSDYVGVRSRKAKVVPGLGFDSRAVQSKHTGSGLPGPADYTKPEPQMATDETPQFRSRSVKSDPRQNTPSIVGPGRYEGDAIHKLPANKNPAFASGTKRMPGSENDVPSPDSYSIKRGAEIRPATVVNTRYCGHDDWLAVRSVAPSPENYNIDRGVGGKGSSFPRQDNMKKAKKEKLGPGSYNIAPSMIKKTCNSGVVPFKH